METSLQFSVVDATASIQLNRPKVGNAIDLDLARELLAAAQRCHEDSDIRCVVLTGTGRFFCTGGDIASFSDAGDQVPGILQALASTLNEALRLFSTMRKPVVIAVNGPAAGAGLGLAVCGDFVLCARSAHFSCGYTAIGLTPDAGTTWMLPRLIGLRRAQDMVLSNRRVACEEALSIGLVTCLVDDEALEAETEALTKRLCNSATEALGVARDLVRTGYDKDFDEQLELEAVAIAAAGRNTESREGIAAFVARRKPKFRVR